MVMEIKLEICIIDNGNHYLTEGNLYDMNGF